VLDGSLSLASMSGLLQVNADMSGLAGYLSLSVPFLSAGLVKGMAGTLTHLAQSINGVTQSAGGAAASEAVTGNMSFGNTSFGNHNAFNTQTNHVDSSGRISSGSFTTQLPGGSSLTLTPDGGALMDMRNAISHLPASINLAESIRASYARQAEKSDSAVSQRKLSHGEREYPGKLFNDMMGKFINKRANIDEQKRINLSHRCTV
jgi:conjugal transfer mating pair stabilization protein TraG